MNNAPDGVELLRTARKVVRDKLSAGACKDRRYQALMVANAMAIAARELQTGDRFLREELRMLEELYGESAAENAGNTLREKVSGLNARLARDIRAGVMDGACAQGVRVLLKAQVIARLRVSNPKYLKTFGIE